MKNTLSAIALMAALSFSSAALAQDPPSGGMNAKGNAPLKNTHTVNDGAAKAGANSFTQNEARKHILNSGYTGVSGLAKGKDGVWRGTAMRGGANVNVALDFKGNVAEGGPVAAAAQADNAMKPSGKTTTAKMVDTTTTAGAGMAGSDMNSGASTSTSTATMHHHRHRRHRHHAMMSKCAQPGPNGVACSGQDKNHNGISDKEDRAIKAGAKP